MMVLHMYFTLRYYVTGDGMMETHDLIGGKLHVYKRDNSRFWQCSTFLAGKNWRITTKEESLSHAKEIAEDWYLELRGKSRAGQLKTGKTFKEAADTFIAEYETLTAGQRNPFLRAQSKRMPSGLPASILWKARALGDHARLGAGVSGRALQRNYP
jgi:hypothetical protein